MTEQAKKAPLFYGLAQIVFNPIEDMEAHLPNIQSKLRQLGYPDFEHQHQVQVEMRGAHTDVSADKRTHWQFHDMDGHEGFILLKNLLVFHTARYTNFSDFLDKLMAGLQSVHEVVNLAYTERIGFRYLDAIYETADWPLEAQVHSGLLGAETQDSSFNHAFTETVEMVNDGQLLIRSYLGREKLLLPSDLELEKLNMDESLVKTPTGRALVLDTDNFVKRRRQFDLQSIREQLNQSHDVLLNAFRRLTTEQVRTQLWGIK